MTFEDSYRSKKSSQWWTSICSTKKKKSTGTAIYLRRPTRQKDLSEHKSIRGN